MKASDVADILKASKTVAVVGLSSNPMRASLGVSRFLQRQGFRIIPVNPNETIVLGETAYPTLTAVPEPIDIVNVFRRSDAVLPIVEEAIPLHPKLIWMQEGVVNPEAAELARAAGIAVVMDRCILKELARLFS